MIKHGILLAGGTGSRLQPFTSYVSKQLLNVAGKPVIDYPIMTLRNIGVEYLTIVVGSMFSGQILDYVQDGSKYGLQVNYCYQPAPKGIAHAIDLCERFTEQEKFVVILGDNIFSSDVDFTKLDRETSAKIVLYKHHELKRFGVASINDKKEIVKIEEKPQILNSSFDNYAIVGCYQFDKKFFEYFKNMAPSARGEYEITDIIRQYHDANDLGYVNYNVQNGVWLDAGTHDSIALANNYFYSLNQVKYGTA